MGIYYVRMTPAVELPPFQRSAVAALTGRLQKDLRFVALPSFAHAHVARLRKLASREVWPGQSQRYLATQECVPLDLFSPR